VSRVFRTFVPNFMPNLPHGLRSPGCYSQSASPCRICLSSLWEESEEPLC